jgi:hypothetical protein
LLNEGLGRILAGAVVFEFKTPVLLFTIADAILITNLFGPRTLVALVASSFGLSTAASGTMAMISVVG